MATSAVLTRRCPVALDPDTVPMDRDRDRGWAAVRAAGPVVRIGETVVLTRREDVVAALRDPAPFSSRRAFDQMGCPLPLVPIAFDPPEHTRFRKILQPFFSPRALAAMMPALRAQAEELVDGLAARGGCDAVAEVAVPYPSQVFLTMFGFPLADRDRLIGWKDGVLAVAAKVDPDPDELTGPLELFGYVCDAVARRREHPGDDVLSALLTGEDPLTEQEAVGLCFLFVLAGLDTVTSALGWALCELARRPELQARLRAEPGRVGEFVEEILRLEGPVPQVPRVATRDTTVGGVDLPEGSLVWLALGSANRDAEAAEVAPPPDVRLDGGARRHWAFGGGPHRCLGSHLARLELALVLTAWLERIPRFALAPGADPRMPYPAATFSLPTLPLVYPPAG